MTDPGPYARLMEYNNISKELDDIYRNTARSFGISECSLWILYILRAEKGPMTQSVACDLLFYPKQTINSALKKMESDGLIKLRHVSDRRSKQIELTGKGELLAVQTADRVLRAEHGAMSGLSDQEQEIFIGLWRKYTDLLKSNMQALHENEEEP